MSLPVGRDSPPGFFGVEHGSIRQSPAPLSCAILAQPTATLSGWSLFTMVQPPLHLRCPWATVLDGMRARATRYRLFVPLFGVDGQSLPKGRRCHSSTKRAGISPARSSSYTVEYFHRAAHPSHAFPHEVSSQRIARLNIEWLSHGATCGLRWL